MKIPRILFSALPEAEQRLGLILDQQLSTLPYYVTRFGNAAKLAEFSRASGTALPRGQTPGTPERDNYFSESQKYIDWQHIALRDAGSTVWDIAIHLHRMRANRDKLPTIKAAMPGRALENALDMFSKTFPEAKAVRDSLAHPTDIVSSEGRQRENAVNGPFVGHGITMTDKAKLVSGLYSHNGQGVVINDGKIYNFEVTQSSLDSLIAVRDAVFAAFEPASKASFALYKPKTEAAQTAKDKPGGTQ